LLPSLYSSVIKHPKLIFGQQLYGLPLSNDLAKVFTDHRDTDRIEAGRRVTNVSNSSTNESRVPWWRDMVDQSGGPVVRREMFFAPVSRCAVILLGRNLGACSVFGREYRFNEKKSSMSGKRSERRRPLTGAQQLRIDCWSIADFIRHSLSLRERRNGRDREIKRERPFIVRIPEGKCGIQAKQEGQVMNESSKPIDHGHLPCGAWRGQQKPDFL
jgi:hypothetical protein